MILAGFALFIIFLLVIGMPVAFTLSIAGILGIIQFIDMSTLSQVPVIAYKTLDSYVLTSVPLYILMSQIMLTGKVGSGLFELGSKWMGHLPGGLASRLFSPVRSLRRSPALLWRLRSLSVRWRSRKC